jgi:hypothetical protein
MIQTLGLILINLIWVVYSLTEGVREGHFGHFENLRRRKCSTDINKLFKIQRFIVLISLSLISLWLFNLTSMFFVMTGLFLMFSYLHNGGYHCTRNKLDSENYKLGFNDGDTLGFFSTFRSYRERIIFFMSGVALQLFLYIFIIN